MIYSAYLNFFSKQFIEYFNPYCDFYVFAYNLEGNMFVSIVLLLPTGISHLKLIFMTYWLSGEHNSYVLIASVSHFFDDRSHGVRHPMVL